MNDDWNRGLLPMKEATELQRMMESLGSQLGIISKLHESAAMLGANWDHYVIPAQEFLSTVGTPATSGIDFGYIKGILNDWNEIKPAIALASEYVENIKPFSSAIQSIGAFQGSFAQIVENGTFAQDTVGELIRSASKGLSSIYETFDELSQMTDDEATSEQLEVIAEKAKNIHDLGFHVNPDDIADIVVDIKKAVPIAKKSRFIDNTKNQFIITTAIALLTLLHAIATFLWPIIMSKKDDLMQERLVLAQERQAEAAELQADAQQRQVELLEKQLDMYEEKMNSIEEYSTQLAELLQQYQQADLLANESPNEEYPSEPE